MAQAGIHGVVGIMAGKWTANRQWLILGIVLGNLFPDLDNIAVAIATVAGLPTEGLHRTFTHSLFTVAAIIIVFYIVAKVSKKSRWYNLGLGLGIGVLMHILLDLLIWFNGVEILWPLPLWVNLWSNVTPPTWWMQLMMPAEFLFFGLFFLFLLRAAHQHGSDESFWGKLRVLAIAEIALFVIFTIMVYTMSKGFMTPYGAVYLISLGIAIGVTIRMRQTVELTGQK